MSSYEHTPDIAASSCHLMPRCHARQFLLSTDVRGRDPHDPTTFPMVPPFFYDVIRGEMRRSHTYRRHGPSYQGSPGGNGGQPADKESQKPLGDDPWLEITVYIIAWVLRRGYNVLLYLPISTTLPS